MANSVIGNLVANLSLNTANFEAGARKARTTTRQLQNDLGGLQTAFRGLGGALQASIGSFIAGISVGAITEAIKSALEYAGSLAEVAQQLGVTAQDLQVFRLAAGQVGVSQEELETGLSKLTITLGKLAAGAQEPAKALKAIGISAAELKGKDAGEALRIIADGLQKVTDRSQRAAIEVALFGKTGSKLDNLLSGGSKAIDDFRKSAEKLGIVLSDEQIQNADRTADKIEELSTAFRASFAGVVANNADAIFKFADSLISLIGKIPDAINAIKRFHASFLETKASIEQEVAKGLPRFFGAGFAADAQALKRNALKLRLSAIKGFTFDIPRETAKAPAGADIEKFLAPAPKAAKAPRAVKETADRSAEVLAGLDKELIQATQSILQARQQLAGSAEEHLQIAIQLVQIETSQKNKAVDEEVAKAGRELAEHKITQAAFEEVQHKAEILKGTNEIEKQIKLQAIVEDQLTRADKANFEAADQQRQFQIEALQFRDDMATTEADHRRIQLQILDAQIAQQRLELEHEKQLAIRNGATAEEIAIIDDKIAHLGAQRLEGAAKIVSQTPNPLEAFAKTVPKTASEIIESFQEIEVKGIEGLGDALTDVITGTKNLKEAFADLAKSIIHDLVQIAVKMLIFQGLKALGLPGFKDGGSLTIGAPGFATGGAFTIGGNRGTDRNLLSLNGIPVARVSYGERINIGNDGSGGQRFVINQTIAPNFAGNAATKDDLVRMGVIAKNSAIQAIRESRRRAA